MAGMLCLSRRQANCIDLCLISYLGNGALSTHPSHYYYGGLTLCNAQAGIIVTFVSFLTEKMPHYSMYDSLRVVQYCTVVNNTALMACNGLSIVLCV
jgi:hypothetical protein